MKGVTVVWLSLLAGFFLIAVIFALFTPSVTQILDVMANQTSNADALTQFDRLETVWLWWPFVIIAGLVIAWIVAGQRREPSEYYGGI